MSNAKQCDKCKELYVENGEDRKLVDKQGEEWVVCIRIDTSWSRDSWRDICDRCINELLNLFLKCNKSS